MLPATEPVKVSEVFFSLDVNDMQRATTFYTTVFGATVSYATPRWTSLHLARVRIGLFLNPKHSGAHAGVHLGVPDLDAACAAVERGGGKIAMAAMQAAPDVFIAEATDTEGNVFTLRKD